MFSSSAPAQIDRIDQLLDNGTLDEETTEKLCNLLNSGTNGTGVNVQVLFHLAEHPTLVDALEQRTLPQPLQKAIAESIGAASAMLGEWSGAPLPVQIERLRRRFDREEKKYRLVRDKLEEIGPKAGGEVLSRYLDTSPAPMFSKQLAADFAGMYDRAQDQQGADHQALTGDERLVELLAFDEPMDEDQRRELKNRLDEVADGLRAPQAAVQRALVGSEPRTGIVAGAVAVRERLTDQSHNLVTAVVQAEPFAPQAAVFAAWLAPSLVRHVLSRFLVDILNDGTPTEDLKADEQAVRDAIVAARTVLPKIGSPVDEIDQVDETAERIAARVRRAWEFCTQCYGEPLDK